MPAAQRLVQRAGQALALTPTLLRSIKLLSLSGRDLAALIERELADNPFLRREAAAPAPRSPVPAARDNARFPPAGTAPAIGGADAVQALPEAAAGAPGLHRHLADQIALAVRSGPERRIAEGLLEMLSEAGYVEGDLAALAARLRVSLATVEAVLRKLQGCEPTGIFARDLAECLGLQLAERGRLDEPMRILLGRLDLLARRDFPLLARLCGVAPERLTAMAAEIRALDPKPGARFAVAAAAPVIADLLLEETEAGGWSVAINPAVLPPLALDSDYRRAAGKGAAAKAERAWLDERFAAAAGLLRAIERRRQGLLDVAALLVRRQEAFLRHGPDRLRPLTRREVALALNLHESTVGRIVAGKFIDAPGGLIPLRAFFGPGLAASPDAEPAAAAAVRRRLAALIAAEGSKSLSDAALAAKLAAEGVALSRRTVSKYRKLLRIPDSKQRGDRKRLPSP